MATTATMTGAQFDALPYEEGCRWELLAGELIPVASATLNHQELVYRILTALKQHLIKQPGIVSQDVEFALAADTRVRPDVWLVLGPRAAQIDPDRVPIPGCPDLAVEVISPSEYASESMRKVDSYLKNGVTEVWQVYPKSQQVISYTSSGEMRRFESKDSLTSKMLVNFEFDIAKLFS